MPADWTMSLVYSIGYFAGAIQLRATLEFYEEEDKKDIELKWQPTATHYINYEE